MKGRQSFSDIKARQDTTYALKDMIRSWLDEMYPKMPEAERIAMSERLDMSLIERKKAESMKTFFELNNVVRVSFIEMQYMKRVSWKDPERYPTNAKISHSLSLLHEYFMFSTNTLCLGNDECVGCHGRCYVSQWH